MRGERPILCLVTDRTRLGGGDRVRDLRARLSDIAREAVDAGVDLIQVRERGLEAARLVELVADLVAIARGSATRIIVNDRIDVALTCDAGGVHLRSDSIAPAAARSLMPAGLLVGRSVHALDEARAHAASVEYLIAGTVYATPSKPGRVALLGESGLRQIAAAVRVPVLAIGGMTIERAAAIAATGASGIAGIRLFLPSASSMSRTVASVRAQFDRVRPAC